VIAKARARSSISDGVFSNNVTAIHSKDTSTLTVGEARSAGTTPPSFRPGQPGAPLEQRRADNKTGFTCGTGGTIASTGDNRRRAAPAASSDLRADRRDHRSVGSPLTLMQFRSARTALAFIVCMALGSSIAFAQTP
jgi:hypothetical protein